MPVTLTTMWSCLTSTRSSLRSIVAPDASGDWGSTITEHLARSHASSVVGIHLTDVPFWHIFQRPSDLTQ